MSPTRRSDTGRVYDQIFLYGTYIVGGVADRGPLVWPASGSAVVGAGGRGGGVRRVGNCAVSAEMNGEAALGGAMKKQVLALGVAATVSHVRCCCPCGVCGTRRCGGGWGDGGGEEASISTGAIVGITLGVLAAAGLGGAVAVQQEWLKLPDPLNAQVLGGMASLSSALSIPGPAPKPAEKPAVGSCPPAAFNAAVPEWPAGFGTSVSYCDGRWAVAGAKGTDWILFFKHLNGKWAKISSDGTTRRGMTRACYNGIKLREQGAAEAFMREVPVCTPGEIGR